jgi:protein TonB
MTASLNFASGGRPGAATWGSGLAPLPLALVVLAHAAVLLVVALQRSPQPLPPVPALMVEVLAADSAKPVPPLAPAVPAARALRQTPPQPAVPRVAPQPSPRAVLQRPQPASARPVLASASPTPSETVTAPKEARAAPQPEPAPATTAAVPSRQAPVGEGAVAPASSSTPTTPNVAPAPATTAPRFDPNYLSNPKPAYPPLSRKLNEQGTVKLRVLVEASGQPGKVDVAQSSGFERLDKAAAAAVSKWTFTPARQGSVAVSGWVNVPIVFSLME